MYLIIHVAECIASKHYAKCLLNEINKHNFKIILCLSFPPSSLKWILSHFIAIN